MTTDTKKVPGVHPIIIILLVLSPFILYFYDIGNPDALRQGTEGFYLRVLSEMKEAHSFLVPLFDGRPHFSKPPLGFWMAWPFIGGDSSILFGARLSILLSSFLSIFFISRSVSRHLRFNAVVVCIFMLSTFGAIKYLRIFMLEAPLALLGTLAALWLYDSFESKSILRAIFAGVVLGLAGLTKGPVSFVMAGLSLVLYFLFERRFPRANEVKSSLWALVFALITFIPWFAILGMKFGDEFWNYFLVRENLGKFTSKSYSPLVLFQGLFMFLLPWSLVILASVKGINTKWRERKWSERKYLVYLMAFALGHFVIWFIPSQRSHHYAFPSTFFFLFIVMSLCSEATSLKRTITTFFALLFILLGYLSLSFGFSFWPCFLVALFLVFVSLSKGIKFFSAAWSLALLTLWYVIAPGFALSILPQGAQELIGSSTVAVAIRKPFFVEEELKREIAIVSYDRINNASVTADYFLTDHIGENYLKNLTGYQEVLQYPVWRRGAKLKEIIAAIKAKDLGQLQTRMHLLKKEVP